MKYTLYKDEIGYATDEVSSVKVCESNTNEENRIKFITDIAAISRGKDSSNNPPMRYKKLLKEAAPISKDETEGSAGRPFEFLPVNVSFIKINTRDGLPIWYLARFITTDMQNDDNKYLEVSSHLEKNFDVLNDYITKSTTVYVTKECCLNHIDFLNKVVKYSYVTDVNSFSVHLHTSMRCLLNAGIPYEMIPYNYPYEVKDFKVIKACIPMFIWAQVPCTHTQISSISQSDRVATNNDYWLPGNLTNVLNTLDITKLGKDNEIVDKVKEILGDLATEAKKPFSKFYNYTVDKFINVLPQKTVQEVFECLKYNKEIYSRATYYFKYKECVMGAWLSNPDTWQHLFLQRGLSSEHHGWTQSETQIFVEVLNCLVNDKKYKADQDENNKN